MPKPRRLRPQVIATLTPHLVARARELAKGRGISFSEALDEALTLWLAKERRRGRCPPPPSSRANGEGVGPMLHPS